MTATKKLCRQLLDLRKPSNPADHYATIRRNVATIDSYLAGAMTLPACCDAVRGSEAWIARRLEYMRDEDGKLTREGFELKINHRTHPQLDPTVAYSSVPEWEDLPYDNDAIEARERELATAKRERLTGELANESEESEAYQGKLAQWSAERAAIIAQLPAELQREHGSTTAEVLCATWLRRHRKPII